MQQVFEGCEIEKASIDEQYIDLSELVRNVIIDRYPFLKNTPENELDSELPDPPVITWADKGNLIPNDEELDDEGNIKDDSEINNNWQDVAISIGAEIVAKARKEMFDKLEYTCSAGISKNKILAKLCSTYKKPNDQTILRESAVKRFLSPLKFQKIRSLGGKYGEAIANKYDANTISDLWKISLEEMQNQLGEESIWIYNTIRGENYDEVKEKIMNKTMLASKSLRPSVSKIGDVKHWLKILSSELSQRLKEMRSEPGKESIWPKSIVLSMNPLYMTSRSHQAVFPYSKELGPELILKSAEKLLKEFISGAKYSNKNISQDSRLDYEINKIALSFSGLSVIEAVS